MFSQNQEEKYILEYFEKRGSLSNPTPPPWVVHRNGPTFLDLGANDGVTFSNTRALALTGQWKGVLVEPSPKAYERLKTLYNGQKGFYCYPFAITDVNGKKILQESGPLCSAADVGLVSTFHASEMDRFKRTVKYDPVEVKTFRWKTFLNRLTLKEFDFISADCENDEMKFIPDMDLSQTSLICLEHNGNQQRKDDYLYYTSKYGLTNIIYESGENILISR